MGTTDAGDEVFRGHEEKILVSVRLRPLNDKEIARNDVSDWECLNDNTVIYKNANLSVSERSMYPTAYTFDRVFRYDCSTRKVYEQGAKEVALCVVSGINSTVFAYGQTSSGKTYTMTGITEYTIADIYDYLKKHPEREFLLKFSAIEIYNESVRDLLCADSTPLRLLDDPERGTVVEKLTEETVRDWNHVRELLSICEAQRQIGETSLNETSSRSHQVIKLTIESSSRELLGRENPSTLVAAVSFVDLAGSERASQSLSAGTRLKEGCHINRSLLTLGSVIRKLSKGRTGHIPFRDSKLTRILQSSLGGNARTAIICTMSPARTHVEQSRNTLLFASCAKEVTSNAQINVVMSDKALVKHLQRELARLESEIKSPGSTFTTSNYAELLREKDLQIEKMEKEIKDLTMQREIAQSQVEELLRLVDDQNSLLRVGLGQYPSLRVRESPRNGVPEPETSMFADSDSPDYTVRILATPQYSDGGSDTNSESSESRSVQLIDVQENIMQNNTPPRISISSSRFSETDSCHGWEDMEERSSGTSDDLCKEVRCIETEESESRTGRHVESDCLSTKGNTKDSAPINIPNGERSDKEELSSAQSEEDGQCNSPSLKENEGIGSKPLIEDREVVSSPLKEDGEVALSPLKEDEEVVLSPLKEDREVVSSPLKEDKELTSPDLKEAKELSSIQLFNVHSPDKTSPPHDPTEDLSANGILQLTRSRSCKAMLMASMPFQRSDKEENNENTPPNWSEKDFTGRPDGFVRKFSALNYGADLERSSRHGSKSSKGSIAGIELESQNEYASVDKNEPRDNTFTTGTKGVTALQPSKQVTDDSVNESEEKANECPKNVKDVGLDPIEEAFSSPSNWPSEFKRLQRAIIKLWHTCSVSLVHRTYFFLLFKGDPTDSIYMEVELRRLSFLEETFSQGSQTVEFGHTLSHSSSLKSLHRERHMLSRQMRKKLSEQERENLYLKWGIRLKDKNRRLQLAYRLWTNTEDMGHIADSAIIIAKLVRHIEPDKFPKEIFGLNFAPPPTRTRRSYSLTRSLISLL